MARQHTNGFVSGQIGPIVSYVMNGQGYIRARAFKVKQTQATKECSGHFSQSKRTGARLREQITLALPNLENKKIMPGFDATLYRWLRLKDRNGFQERLPFIDRYEFNAQSPLHTRFRQPFGVDFNHKGKIHITIPDFDLPADSGAPSQTQELHWHIVATSCQIEKETFAGSAGKKLEMAFTPGIVAPQTVTLDLDLQKGTLTVVVVALRYHAIWKGNYTFITEPAWLPTAVVGCCYNG